MSFDEDMVVERVKRLTRKDLRVWMRRGWLCPAEGPAGPVFDELDIARIRLLCDLSKEMSIPRDVLPVVLNLIDCLHKTRRDLHALTRAIEDQPDDIRRSVVSTFLALHSDAPSGAKKR